MGVKGLFSYLRRKYTNSITNNSNISIDAIYLDGNALLYPIAEYTKIPEEIGYRLLTVAKQYALTYNCICHIYMDGPAHMGKIRQQRMRRFLYEPTRIFYTSDAEVGNKKEQVSILNTYEWSPAMFSPGTDMMERIHIYIQDHLSEYTMIGIYSSYHDPGEGEHKIVAHIKNTVGKYVPGIVGKDADLILLAMGINDTYRDIMPYILRHNDREKEDGYTPEDPMYYINCTLLRENILSEYGRDRSIWDFIISTFLIGNDFLPSIPGLENINDALPLIMKISPILYVDGTISVSGMNAFIEILNTHITNIVDPIHYFHVSPYQVDTKDVTFPWYITIWWIFIYYHDGLDVASRAWQYPLHYAPTIHTLANNPVENTYEIGKICYEDVSYLSPHQALSAILPIWLHNLLPYSVSNEYMQYYPYHFSLSESGDPIISPIPYDVVKKY